MVLGFIPVVGLSRRNRHALDLLRMTLEPSPEVKQHPGPGQESCWDYPRPPRLEMVSRRLRVIHGGQTLADSVAGYRVCETYHPPTYYIPREDCRMDLLQPGSGSSYCEFKGRAQYFHLPTPNADGMVRDVAWSYPKPTTEYAPIREHLAFYSHKVDSCLVDNEQVTPQPGAFYGGWITSDVVGPFKGGPGTMGW
eukprot:CAMPEP_0184680158 /NCGR_PEP_ID=MMETSP0312-20130426/3046_1 /TAXON_ID=31354 /ORGANISM="Compsopogon coeruleus, Strain SAG 36.94" /LENGTH=194 /DNA_ID=CAMNT_0027130097 /DNA_START=156 /DNA_END=740 /DNA_ORIENTATION=+